MIQHSDSELVEAALGARGSEIELKQIVRGEAVIQVAAASILARARFIVEMDKLSAAYGFALPRGAAGHVDEAGRQLMLSAAAMKDRGVKYTQQASMAKLYASEMVNRVTARAVQIHGGYGFIREYPVERFYRDARVFTIYEGTSEIQRVVISNHIFQDRRTP